MVKVGLVLEGGGMRGLYTAGVLDAFLDAKIKVDKIVSVSAGALFGVNFASKQRGRTLRYNKKYMGNPDYMSLKSWLTTGNYVNREFSFYKLPMDLDKFDQAAFAQSGIDFYATVTNLETGQAEYIQITDVFEQMEVLRASSALPLASKIVNWQGKSYLDGGLSDSIPLDFARQLGVDKLIVVLTQPADYRKKPSKGLVYKTFYRSYPKLVETASRRAEQYNARVEEIQALEEVGQIFAVRPVQSLAIGRLEKDITKFDQVYQRGLEDAYQLMPSLKS